MKPPVLPANHVNRQTVLDTITAKLLEAPINPDGFSTTVNITGSGGFGKTTIVKSLCHQPIVKENFADGFVFIELGPQATDPSVKLSQ